MCHVKWWGWWWWWWWRRWWWGMLGVSGRKMSCLHAGSRGETRYVRSMTQFLSVCQPVCLSVCLSACLQWDTHSSSTCNQNVINNKSDQNVSIHHFWTTFWAVCNEMNIYQCCKHTHARTHTSDDSCCYYIYYTSLHMVHHDLKFKPWKETVLISFHTGTNRTLINGSC